MIDLPDMVEVAGVGNVAIAPSPSVLVRRMPSADSTSKTRGDRQCAMGSEEQGAPGKDFVLAMGVGLVIGAGILIGFLAGVLYATDG